MLLSTPLRIFWRITAAASPPDTDSLATIARAIAAARPFEVTVSGAPLEVELLPELLAPITETGIPVTVIERPERIVSLLASSGLKGVALISGIDDLRVLAKRCQTDGFAMDAVHVSPEWDVVKNLAEMLPQLAYSGVRRVVIPNPDLVSSGARDVSSYVYGPERIARLAASLEEVYCTTGIPAIIAHDLFLAKALGLVSPEYGGCQAGNAICFISPDGTVFPCATLPVSLGNLADASLKAVWAGEKRRELIGQIANSPDCCRDCEQAASCRGGCRGMAHVAGGGFDGPDPGCDLAAFSQ
ncbi:MAG: SPASM domain-containing protein [Nitrospirae bacterium]|nr:SPASM domain-containing protein [Nitrospirota bacterium]